MERHEDDHDEQLAARTVPGGRSLVVPAVGVAAALVLVCAGAGLGLVWLRSSAVPEPAGVPGGASSAEVDPTKRVYTRFEFMKLAYGKTKAELTDLFGPPARTEGTEPNEKWVYTGRAHDERFGNTADQPVNLWFKDGKVNAIDFLQE